MDKLLRGARYKTQSQKELVLVAVYANECWMVDNEGKRYHLPKSDIFLCDGEVNKVGHIGFKSIANFDGNKKKSYLAWVAMIEKAYTRSGERRGKLKVCDDWLCFAKFDKWYDKQRKAKSFNPSMVGIVKKRFNVYRPQYCELLGLAPEPKPAKQYRLKAPDGSMVTTTNLKQFCKRHNLQLNLMYKVLKGTLHQHKGYKRWS